MSDRLIAAVIPSSGPCRRDPGGGVARPVRALPLADPRVLELPGVVYGMGRVDRSGRVADRAVTAALGWRAGTRLTMTAVAHTIVAARDPGGVVVLAARAYVPIPGGVRRRVGVRPGERVLLAAVPLMDQLVLYPLATVHEALSGLHEGERS